MPDHVIHAGSIAFSEAPEVAEAALSRREGLQDVHFIRSGPCTEYPALTRYVVEVHGEHDARRAQEWMDRLEEALAGHVGHLHRCQG